METPKTVLEFADYLGIRLYDWQAEIVLAIDSSADKERVKLAVRAPNESGKTSRINVLSALWWLYRYNGKVVVTSKDNRQIGDQFWPALRRLLYKFPDWKPTDSEYTVITPESARLRAFTTKDPGRAEGFHHEDNQPLLVIVDEAKSIDEIIFESVDRCSYNVLLYISSPGGKEGRFYESFQSDSFLHYHAGLADCPHISKERIEDTIKWYGENAEMTRSTLHGDFMDRVEGVIEIIGLGELEKWRETSIGRMHAQQQVFACDFARGGDENVIVHRIGNYVAKGGIFTSRDKDTSRAVYEMVAWLKDHGYDSRDKHTIVIADASGVGGPMCDQMRRLGVFVTEFNFGGHTDDPHYKNEGTRVWYQTAQKIRENRIVCPPYHQPEVKRLFSQLSSRRQESDDMDNKLSMESKAKMKARGIASPDIADAFCMAFAMPDAQQSSWVPFDDTRRQEIAQEHGWQYSGSWDDDGYGDRRDWNRPNRPGDNDRSPFHDSIYW
jgi:phage terminase large subunit